MYYRCVRSICSVLELGEPPARGDSYGKKEEGEASVLVYVPHWREVKEWRERKRIPFLTVVKFSEGAFLKAEKKDLKGFSRRLMDEFGDRFEVPHTGNRLIFLRLRHVVRSKMWIDRTEVACESGALARLIRESLGIPVKIRECSREEIEPLLYKILVSQEE